MRVEASISVVDLFVERYRLTQDSSTHMRTCMLSRVQLFVHEISQTRILEQIAISYSRGSS